MNFQKFILISLLGSLFFLACGEDEIETQIIRPVRYMPVYATGGSRVRTFSGVAQAGIESRLSFKVSGNVKSIPTRVGDEVKAGELLAQLDAKDYQLQVQQAEAGLAQAEAQERNTSANYERIRLLYENNNASRSDLDAARAANESAKAAMRSAQKQLELARLRVSYTRLTAPVSGSIAAVNVEVNENLQAGQPVVVLTSGAQIEVKLLIPEVLITQIKEGQPVKVAFDAIPDKTFPGTCVEVGVASTGVGTTYPVIVRLDQNEPGIRPGMAASVAINFDSVDERVRFLVPSHSVLEDRSGRFVFIVEPLEGETGFGQIHRRPVTIGELTAEGLEIFEGLSEGDLVVTAGVSRISEGQKVRI